MTNPQLNPQPGPAEPAINVALQDEIRLLRERGLSDECIHGLFSGFNIDAHPEPATHRWSIPLNSQLIGLIWGKANAKPVGLD